MKHTVFVWLRRQYFESSEKFNEMTQAREYDDLSDSHLFFQICRVYNLQ